MTYRQAILKYRLECIIVLPLVWLGKILGHLKPLKRKHGAFLFFSSADLGGAPKVNAQIADTIRDLNPLIIFSKTPRNNGFATLFDIPGVDIIDLHQKIDNKYLHFINIVYRGIIATWIAKSGKPVVFGGECIYFYKIIPHIKKNIPAIELCHLNTWFNYTQTFIRRIDKRIFSTRDVMRQLIAQYRMQGIAEEYYNRIHFIDNYVDIPPCRQNNNDILQVLYVGRGAPQKRVPLIAAIAEKMHEAKDPVHFSFVGDVEKVITIDNYPFCTFYGNVTDAQKLKEIYHQSDCLILTSAYEGLPLVVMEMMARGKTVLSTNVDGIPDYITHKENGLLITEKEEPKIIEQGIALLNWLVQHPEDKRRIEQAAYQYTQQHFSKEVFEKAYRKIFFEQPEQK